jgi:hypothetical protein
VLFLILPYKKYIMKTKSIELRDKTKRKVEYYNWDKFLNDKNDEKEILEKIKKLHFYNPNIPYFKIKIKDKD